MWKRKKPEFPKIPAVRNMMMDSPVPIVTDPNGSYTGRPMDPDDRPIQDADDL